MSGLHGTVENLRAPTVPANTKHLYNICTTSAQRLRHWSNIVQMLYKYFVFTGVIRFIILNNIIYLNIIYDTVERNNEIQLITDEHELTKRLKGMRRHIIEVRVGECLLGSCTHL